VLQDDATSLHCVAGEPHDNAGKEWPTAPLIRDVA
jgi:hypothetical protein